MCHEKITNNDYAKFFFFGGGGVKEVYYGICASREYYSNKHKF